MTFSTSKMYSVIDSLRFENWNAIEEAEDVSDFEPKTVEEEMNDKVLKEWEDDDVDSWIPHDEISRIYESLMEQESALTFNDFEKAAEELESSEYMGFIERFNEIKGKKSILLKGMTGSGSAHYVVFKDSVSDKKLNRTYEKLMDISAWVRKAHFI
jgi:4-diphosphocytidyl-2C-methyl-D-erythritol kinase